MNKTDKLLKLAGITIPDLLTQSCKTDGRLRRTEFDVFWDQVGRKTHEGGRMMKFLLKIMKESESKRVELGIPFQSIINTFMFGVLFIDTRFDSATKRLITNWQNQDDLKKLCRAIPSARDALRLAALKINEQEMYGPLIIGASTLHSVAEFQRMVEGNNGFGDDEKKGAANSISYGGSSSNYALPSGEGAFLYEYIKQLAMDDRSARFALLQTAANKLLTLPQQMRLNPKVAETTLLALLHILSNLISLGSVADRAFLKRLSSLVQQFYMWPCPFGSAAKLVLEVLHAESLSPGHALRNRLVNHARAGAETPLHYWIDTKSVHGGCVYETMELIEYTAPETSGGRKRTSSTDSKDVPSQLSVQDQATLILNLLNTEYEVDEDDVKTIANASAADVASLYKDVEKLDAKLLANPDSAREIRVQVLAELRQKLGSLAPAGDDAIGQPDFDSYFIPPRPELTHRGTKVDTTYFVLNKDQISMSKTHPYPETALDQELQQLLKAQQTQAVNTLQPSIDVNIVLAGGDNLVHNALCAHMGVVDNKPELLERVNLKYFVVPIDDNSLATFIASYDSWYSRHLYVPFRSSPFLVPDVQLDSPTRVEELEDITPPGKFLRRQISSYVAEARNTLNINAYKLEGWIDEPETSMIECDNVVPFIRNVQIGVEVEAEAKGMDINDAKAMRAFDYQPPETTAKYTKMDLCGASGRLVTDDPVCFSDILISNLPNKGDSCFPADPTQPWLEMCARPHRSVQKNLNRNSELLVDPKQHVISLEIRCPLPSGRFNVRVDGQLIDKFGPFNKIRITPLSDDDDNIIPFPVQTFFPVEI